MKVYSSYDKATDVAFKDFLKAKKVAKYYVFSQKIASKQTFYIVFSQKEVEQYNLPEERALQVVGESESSKKARLDYQAVANRPDLVKHDNLVRYIRASRRQRNLEKKLDNNQLM